MSLIPLPAGMTSFDARQVEPAKLFEAVPAGWYNVKIVKSETKPTAKAGGAYLELEFEIIDGEFSGRKVWERLNVVNENEVAVRIAYQQLAALCNATGVINVADSTQLHGIPVRAKFKLVPQRTVGEKVYEPSNEIAQGGFESIQGAPGVSTSTAPSWVPPATTTVTKPDGWAPPSTTPPPWAAAPATQTPAPVPTPPTITPPPAPYPPEAVEWAKQNPTHPQAGDILKTLPPVPQPATPPAWKPPTPGTVSKPPWAKA